MTDSSTPKTLRLDSYSIRLALSVWRYDRSGQRLDPDTCALLLDAVDRLVDAALDKPIQPTLPGDER